MELWKTLIHEGFSVKFNKLLSELFSLTAKQMFIFDTKFLNKTDKQRFSHALSGTGGRTSFLKLIKGEKVGSSIIVPIENAEEARSFLDDWKINYSVRRIYY